MYQGSAGISLSLKLNPYWDRTPSSSCALVSPASAARRMSSRSARAVPDHRSAASKAIRVRAKIVMMVSLYNGVRRLLSSLVQIIRLDLAGVACLFDARENPVQLIHAVVFDHELALGGAGLQEVHARAEFVGKSFLQGANIRVFAAHGVVGMRAFQQAAHQVFGLAHREPLARHLAGGLALRLAAEREQRARMAHVQFALLQHFAPVGYGAPPRRYAVQPGQLRGAPAALAGDNLVTAGADRAHHDRLYYALRL